MPLAAEAVAQAQHEQQEEDGDTAAADEHAAMFGAAQLTLLRFASRHGS
ncbi:hypothetical protein [Streptomyces sp. GbtcB6]|nr:hypothetical protein [Streptomyces sp. GbtcB6]